MKQAKSNEKKFGYEELLDQLPHEDLCRRLSEELGKRLDKELKNQRLETVLVETFVYEMSISALYDAISIMEGITEMYDTNDFFRNIINSNLSANHLYNGQINPREKLYNFCSFLKIIHNAHMPFNMDMWKARRHLISSPEEFSTEDIKYYADLLDMYNDADFSFPHYNHPE